MEQEQTLNDLVIMQNKNILVSIPGTKSKLGNGITMSETRGRKDIIQGICEASHPSLKIANRAMVWFPQYAGLPIEFDGKTYLVVNHEDVVMIEKVQD